MPWWKVSMPGLPRLGFNLGESKWFKLAAKKAFADVDVDGDARLDYKELYIALLRLYDVLNAKLPAHIKVPKLDDVNRLMRKYDKDESGKLDEAEFLELAKALIGTKKDWRDSILLRCGVAVVMKTVGFPFMAGFVEKVLTNNGVQAPPPAVLAFGIETVFKQIAG